MAKAKHKRTLKKSPPSGKSPRSSPATIPVSADPDDQRIIKYSYERWISKQKPAWHPIKMMRYVFWRMQSGITVSDAIRELHWQGGEFWNLVDLKRHAPFREEFKRATILQSRAMADSVIQIAEGRDHISRKEKRRIEKIIDRATRKMANQKSMIAKKTILAQMMGDLREMDKIVMSRNKLQIEAAKWRAKTVNPNEFGDKATVALGSPDGVGNAIAAPIMIQFVGPDGRVVEL